MDSAIREALTGKLDLEAWIPARRQHGWRTRLRCKVAVCCNWQSPMRNIWLLARLSAFKLMVRTNVMQDAA